jgi:hypothetical protein
VTTNEEIHEALMVIDSRLQTIDGKVNLLTRANREPLLKALQEIITTRPILGHIYLMLDGSRNQQKIAADLTERGIKTSPQAVGRWLGDQLHIEHGLIERVPNPGGGKIYRKNTEVERALNLSTKIEKWLEDAAKAETTKRKSKEK